MTPFDISLLAPLLILAGGGLVLLMAGAFSGSGRGTAALAAVVLAGTLAALVANPATGSLSAMYGTESLLTITPYSLLALLLLVLLAPLVLPLFVDGFRGRACKPELAVLLVLSVSGMGLLVGASHMITFYMGLELMSFPLYILAAFDRTNAKSSEAGLKYFVLGSLASALTLFGMALLFAATGKLGFAGLADTIAAAATQPLVLVGGLLVLVGVVFKLSVVPFHMWTPDVYEGSPTPITALMSSLPKIAALVLLVRLLAGPLAPLQAFWLPGLQVLAMASMAVGASVALMQKNLKRLLAWSTIANVGFMLVGVLAHSAAGAAGVLFYGFTYALTSLGLFAGILLASAETTDHLKGLFTRAPWLAAGLALNLFSLAGVPPLAGFMAKLNVFAPAVNAGLTPLVVVAVLMSVVACAYSLMLVKTMYFEAPTTAVPLLRRRGLEVVLLVAALVNVVLGLFPGILLQAARAASGGVL